VRQKTPLFPLRGAVGLLNINDILIIGENIYLTKETDFLAWWPGLNIMIMNWVLELPSSQAYNYKYERMQYFDSTYMIDVRGRVSKRHCENPLLEPFQWPARMLMYVAIRVCRPMQHIYMWTIVSTDKGIRHTWNCSRTIVPITQCGSSNAWSSIHTGSRSDGLGVQCLVLDLENKSKLNYLFIQTWHKIEIWIHELGLNIFDIMLERLLE